MQTRQVNMQRWSITSPKPFGVVLASVEEAIGRPNVIEFTGPTIPELAAVLPPDLEIIA